MLTIFSTPKPFEGHIGIIQRNAIHSWLRLSREIQVILIGDEPGAAEVARQFGILHIKEVERGKGGAKYLSSIFREAERHAHHEIVCYVNCDVMLMSDFLRAVERVSSWRKNFLMVGRRWDIDITEPWDFQSSDWESRLRTDVLARGTRLTQHAIDYFVFPRGMYREIPPLVIGRYWWDHWLLWRARSISVPVVDVTANVMAVHQNHDYAYHPQGLHGVWHGREAQANWQFAGKGRHLFTLDDATHRLTDCEINPNRLYWLAPLRRALVRLANTTWYPVLEATKPIRHALGLRRWRA
jgi:hypothetical protein